jgi:hypothetical protein
MLLLSAAWLHGDLQAGYGSCLKYIGPQMDRRFLTILGQLQNLFGVEWIAEALYDGLHCAGEETVIAHINELPRNLSEA